jgi:ribosomal protein S18 acetylase RimI-like enzyme
MANDEMLREMARHRGFRLVKSRRRKPGSGDFGRYGLTDAAGKKCLGFGKTGLTATAEQVESYLRSIESTSWRRSIGATPAKRAKSQQAKPAEPVVEPSAKPAARVAPRSRNQPAMRARPARPVPAPAKPVTDSSKSDQAARSPIFRIREAVATDTAAIERLLRAWRSQAAASGIRNRLGQLLIAGEPPLVAELDEVVGCVGWHVMPTLQHGKLGRITLILVAERQRRQGIGRALIEAAETRLRKAGCKTIEAISDIAIVNAHGFFRRLGYVQASYRFTRPATPR